MHVTRDKLSPAESRPTHRHPEQLLPLIKGPLETRKTHTRPDIKLPRCFWPAEWRKQLETNANPGELYTIYEY